MAAATCESVNTHSLMPTRERHSSWPPMSSNTRQHDGPIETSLKVSKSLSSLDCKKNPGHKSFIPILSLKPSDLNDGFRSEAWVKFLKLKAHETVRLEVCLTSEKRPDNVPFHNCTEQVRHGSGTAFVTNMGKEQECPFEDCEFPKPHNVSGAFKVMTAHHTVFNVAEALKTNVFFFDDHDNSTVVKARGLRISSVDKEWNRAVVECVTHDLTLCAKLTAFREERNALLKELPGDFKDTGKDGVAGVTRKNNMVAMISHPHGAGKHITVGSVVKLVKDNKPKEVVVGDRDDLKVVKCQVSYTTATCLGSGGGSVNVLCPQRGCIGFAPHFACGEKRTEGVSGLGWTLS